MYRRFSEIRQAYQKKQTSPSELVQEYLKRAEASDLNSYITLCKDRALAQAKSPRPGVLSGIPIAVKDVLTIEGVRTTCGSKILDNYVPPYTATAVQKLEDAGAIILGKLSMDEFAMGSSNENSAFGPVKHPQFPDRVPGGSSGGSAAAVKADLCAASLGSDTGGSIRLPASFCGLVAFKPTYGRISRYGLVAFASSMDQVGPLTHCVQDAADLLEVMVGQDPMDATSVAQKKSNWSQISPIKWKGLKVGLPQEYFSAGLSKDVSTQMDAAVKFLEKKGAAIQEVSLPTTQHAVAVYYLIAVSEASSNLARYDGVRFGSRPPGTENAKNLEEFYSRVRAQFGSEVKRRIVLGTFALSSGFYDAYYEKACQVRRLIAEDFKSAFEKVDLLVGPVCPEPAFKLGERTQDPLKMYLADLLTVPSSLAGLPAMSLPCGETSDGLPVGLQVIGPHFSEERMLSFGQGFENEF